MTEPIKKCTSCQNEIPVGKYYELYKEKDQIGNYCSSCWSKEQIKYEPLIKKGLLKVIEAERERERESKIRMKSKSLRRNENNIRLIFSETKKE